VGFGSIVFWGALLIGRALAPRVLRRLDEARLTLFGLVTAAIGISIVLIAKTLAVVFCGVSICGLGLASVFPIAIATLSSHYGAKASRVGGLMFALGGAGGATIPWVVGFLSTRFSDLRVGLCVPLLGMLIMLGLHNLPSERLRPSHGHTADE
jgi:MFS transporter, FHS family, glucose/mannose:H+ symporter